MPKGDSSYICLVVILVDFVLITDESYYQQNFLKQCKYIDI